MATASGNMELVDLNSLPLQQVEVLLQSFQNDIEFLSTSMLKLKDAHDKLSSSKTNIERFSKQKESTQMLVPVTSAMYVDGELADPEKVIVELGTGYFAEKSISEAEKFFTRKLEFLQHEIEKIEAARNVKIEYKQVAATVFKKKYMEQQQAMANAKA